MPLRGTRPAARAAARVQDVPGRGAGCCTSGSSSAGRSVARTVGPRGAVPQSLAPDPLERVSLDAFLAAAARVSRRKPSPEVAHRPRCADPRRACATRSRRCSRCCPTTGAVQLPRSHARREREARGHRAVPRGARAVQAGRDRPRTGRELRRAHRAAPRPRRAGRARPHVDRRPGDGEPIDLASRSAMQTTRRSRSTRE